MEHPSFTLSALSFIGGIMGYSKKGSLPSLIAGTSFSIIYGYAGYLLKDNRDYGLEIALGSSGLLFAAGFSRVVKAGLKPVPIGLTGLGLLSSLYYGKKYNEFYPFF